MALFGQLSDRAMIAAMHSWGLYWIRVSITEVRDPEDEQRIRHQIDRAELTGRNGRIAGLSSMGAFLIATMAAILAIYVTQSAK